MLVKLREKLPHKTTEQLAELVIAELLDRIEPEELAGSISTERLTASSTPSTASSRSSAARSSVFVQYHNSLNPEPLDSPSPGATEPAASVNNAWSSQRSTRRAIPTVQAMPPRKLETLLVSDHPPPSTHILT